MTSIRRVPYEHGEGLVSFDFVHGGGLVGQRRQESCERLLPDVTRRLQRIRQVHPRARRIRNDSLSRRV